jgi:hypothetical protein
MGQEWKSAPTQTDATNGFFRVKSVTVSNVDLLGCQNTKLRVRLIDEAGQEIQLGTTAGATVLQMAIPSTDGQVSTSDPAVLGLGYLTGDGGVISGIMNAAISLSTAGTSVYDGSNLSPSSADITFYLDPTQASVNIDGQGVGRVTVEAVNNPKALS